MFKIGPHSFACIYIHDCIILWSPEHCPGEEFDYPGGSVVVCPGGAFEKNLLNNKVLPGLLSKGVRHFQD